jgi:hypothetical protein
LFAGAARRLGRRRYTSPDPDVNGALMRTTWAISRAPVDLELDRRRVE